jgi:hypothetical protein
MLQVDIAAKLGLKEWEISRCADLAERRGFVRVDSEGRTWTKGKFTVADEAKPDRDIDNPRADAIAKRVAMVAPERRAEFEREYGNLYDNRRGAIAKAVAIERSKFELIEDQIMARYGVPIRRRPKKGGVVVQQLIDGDEAAVVQATEAGRTRKQGVVAQQSAATASLSVLRSLDEDSSSTGPTGATSTNSPAAPPLQRTITPSEFHDVLSDHFASARKRLPTRKQSSKIYEILPEDGQEKIPYCAPATDCACGFRCNWSSDSGVKWSAVPVELVQSSGGKWSSFRL